MKKKGYAVTAYHLKTVPDSLYLTKQIKHKVCCSPSDTFDAKKVAQKFGVELKIIHVENVFRETIIKYFINEYKRGRTPNPCFFCNDWIKFGVLLERIIQDGNDYVASGHYALLRDGKLYKAKNKEKDQSYFLASIKREKLGYLVFPNGEYNKDEIRNIAKDLNIHIHSKEDSQDLCFIPDNNIYGFLKENGVGFKEGLIIDTKGNILGTHKGLSNYTIGQRKIGIAVRERMYVLRKDFEKNLLVVGKKGEVFNNKFTVSKLNFLQDVYKKIEGYVKVRKKFKEVKCRVYVDNDNLYVETREPIFAITPGQIAVIYDEDGAVIVSGVIEKEGWNGFESFN
ncbi:tRNA (5-methylaminomethyl-2-thiouridylate)-methyltransferase [Thermosipho melanesiensis BI429]|uniref:tRNA-specific 2-thiouridylase MnmA n=1 Tax=Thermosipho melanesiensis (strain DSM 12029 / CIP 104789 / BI429) TaxID=391009 RepID=MNMA_THEM4|nr:RecName: Full=tRNA-specific 2-thiouridylase MnmA [Thermosipho melanesiensis BI429]ABR31404.1 tRNA (5-methylaminomethyl-2-thiouridylate)-methyltransferase [Thermosipho melanesiensis BI429]